jgi:uncharacterized coiled-coil protein SlyX
MKSSVAVKEKSGGAVMGEPAESRIARIESSVGHISGVTTELRVELRRTNDRIDVLTTKVDIGHEKLNHKIDEVHHSLKDKFHSLTVWALLLYFTLAGGLLSVIARAFKWI